MTASERPARVLLIGRHFWPHGSIDAAGHLVELATGLQSAGLQVSVVTPKHSASWPEQFVFREIMVYRPIRMFRTGWTARGDRSPSRYIRYLKDWIESNLKSCDIVFCDSGCEESIAAVAAARAIGVPVVIRIGGNGCCSDFEFFAQHRSGKRCRSAINTADAVVLGTAIDERRWLVEGGQRTRVRRIRVGIGPTPDQGLSSQQCLRLALSRINGDLLVPDSCSVVLSIERLRKDSGVTTLVKSAYSLSQKIDGLQYWLVGDGPARDSIYTQLKGDGLRQSVAMPGSFGLIDDVFSAADLLVHIGDEGFEHQIPAAISAGLPLVMANSEVSRDFFSTTAADVQQKILDRRPDSIGEPIDTPGHQTATESLAQWVWWFDPQRPKTLRFAIDQVVNNLDSARRRAQTLRKTMQRSRPRSESIQHYVDLFRQLIRDGEQQSMEKAQ